MSFFILCIILTLPFENICSQTKLKWGKIPEAQMDIEECPFEEGATSMVLIDQGEIIFNPSTSLKVILNRHKRIKIFDKSASDQGDFKIPYYYKYFLRDLKAQVISKDGEVTPLHKKQIFDEKINDFYKSKNFALPNVQEGSILEIKYTLESPYFSELFEWYFQEEIPVQKSELILSFPKEFEYSFLFQGAKSPEKSEVENGRLFYMDNVPSLKEEAFITSMNNYKNRIRFQLNNYRGTNGFRETYMTTWEELNDEILKNIKIGRRLKSNVAFNKINDQYLNWTKGLVFNNDRERLEAIFGFVKEKITWNNYRGLVCDERLDQVLEDGEGSVQEINLIVAGLLERNNIKSNMVLLPTRDYGYPLELHPFIDQFNYIVACAKIDGEDVFLDASRKMNPIGQLPVNALSTKGFLVDKDGGYWVDLPIHKDVDLTYFNGSINDEGGLSGTWTKQLEAYSCVDAKRRYSASRGLQITKSLEDRFAGVNITNKELNELDEEETKVKYNVDIEIPEACTIANDLMYFNPILCTSFSENPFKLKDRKYPVDMPYPFEEKFILSLEFPDNIQVEELPESKTFSLSDGSGTYNYSAKVVGGRLIVHSIITFTRRSYQPYEYQAVKTLFEQILNKQNEQIVLKRI